MNEDTSNPHYYEPLASFLMSFYFTFASIHTHVVAFLIYKHTLLTLNRPRKRGRSQRTYKITTKHHTLLSRGGLSRSFISLIKID